jgi:hypothetical protein
MQYYIYIILAIFAISVSSANADAQRRLAAAEKLLETDGKTTLQFHSAVYYPREISLKFDGYIVGIEKSPIHKITSSDADLQLQAIPNAGLKNIAAAKKEILGHAEKLLFVSHIIQNQADSSYTDNCFVYNAYNQNSNIQQFAKTCQGFSNDPLQPKNAFTNSWTALDTLKDSLSNQVQSGKYTHVVVITMGWNTVQEEAVRNFNSIVTNLKAANSSFNPLVIGVTWPSEWEGSNVEKVASFPDKSADADKLGLTWLGVLLQETLPKANTKLPVIVVGHSFGSRASSVAACVGPAIYQNNPQNNLADNNINTLMNYEGAFKINRLFKEEDNGIHYSNQCKNVSNVVLTASSLDSAVNDAIWGNYAGNVASFDKYCKNSQIRCKTAKSDGEFDANPSEQPSDSNITYIDASKLIDENAYNTGGGAHNDIYRKEHGVLLNKIINRDWN